MNHVLNLGYSTYQQSTSLSVGVSHQFTNNAIQYLTTLGEDTVARSTFENVGRRQSHGLTLNGSSMLFKKLHLGLNSSANYIALTGSGQQQNQGITWNASGIASLRVRNPFQQYRRFLSEVQDPTFWQWQESYSVIRQYSATLQYRFGKVHAGAPRKRMNQQVAD